MGTSQSTQAVNDRTQPLRRALIFGFDYSGLNKLNGPVNDAKLVSDTLIKYYGYDMSNITILNDGDILGPLTTFINESIDGDQSVIHYSGHGDYINGTDYLVREDLKFINSTTISQSLINGKGNFLIVIDACDSGSIVQLPYTCTSDSGDIQNVNENKFNCNIVNFSAAGRSQNSYESRQIDGLIYGNFTYDFYTTLSVAQTKTWLDVYKQVYREVMNTELPVLNCSDIKLYYRVVDDYI